MSDLDGDCSECLGKGLLCICCGEPMGVDDDECHICGSVESEPCEKCMNQKEGVRG